MNKDFKNSNNRPTISACMIVKNEERFLPQCLESIKDAVDEIIIVDTGSTDKTVEIAKTFGAKVYHHPWRNSFSEARNHSLRYATSDWILQIDADEELERKDIPVLHKIVCNAACNAFYVAIYSELPSGQSKHYFTRLFRRGKAHYEGIVHNQLVHSGNVLPSEVRMYHYGYNLSMDEMEKKYKRTGDLLRKQLEVNPEDIFVIANLVRNYRNECNYDEVINLAEKGLKTSESTLDQSTRNQRQRISVDLAFALLRKDKLDKAEDICKKALKEDPDFLDNLFMLGDILSRKKAFHEALEIYKKFLVVKEKDRKSPDFNLLIVDTYEYEHKVYNNIGECYRSLGLLNEAEKAYKKAIELDGKETLCYSTLTRFYISQNRLDEAANMLDSAIQSGIADHLTYLLLGDIQTMQKKTTDAIDSFKKAIQMDNRNITAYTCLINLLIQSNQLEEAEFLLKKIFPFYPDHIILKCLYGKINYRRGHKESALKFVRCIMASNPSDNKVCLELGNLCLEIQEYALAIEAYEKYLREASASDAKVLTNIALCYAGLGQTEPAIVGLKAVLRLDPSYQYAAQNLAVLEKR
ncbi:MAG: tetratricopeptide repeat protein [Candidatus Kuenenia sp.]|nr:tetratricopeptide repeat protein [Candidatus Kuenenia hertensis]